MAIALEDFTPGQVIEGAPIGIARDELVAFAHAFDPQPFHLDERAAADTFAGRLIGSGWQTASLGMRLLHRDAFQGNTTMGSPGIEELRWLKPVLPGDTLRARIAVEDVRPSGSKPDRGFVRFAMTLLNGRDESVMTQRFSVIFARRDAAALPPRAVPAPTSEAPETALAPPHRLTGLAQAEIGTVLDLGCEHFTSAAIVAFAEAYDPQAMHLNAEEARRTHFGGLCASGWHTAAAWMKCLHATWRRDAAFTRESGGTVPQLGPSPGFKNLRWLAPVYAGDTLRYRSELIDKRASGSRPDWGLATHENTAENQRGEPVFAFTGTVFWQWTV